MDIYFKHYLVFSFGRVEILEPIGFDGFNSTLEQDKSRFGRDIYFGGDKDLSLSFSDSVGDLLDEPRMLDNGQILRHINSGLDLLLNEFKTFGNEAIIYYELEQDGEVINIGQLFKDKTDGVSYIDCKVKKVTEEANYETDKDTAVDLFGTTNLRGETITPIQTQKMLLRAKPITQISEWGQSRRQFAEGSPTNIVTLASFRYFNPCQNVLKYGIEDTLSNLETTFGNTTKQEKARFVRASTNLSQMKLKVTSNIIHNHRYNNVPDPLNEPSRSAFQIYIGRSADGITMTEQQQVYSSIIQENFAVNAPVPSVIELDVNFFLNQGEYFIIWFETSATQRAISVNYNDFNISSFLTFNNCNFELTAVSTAISTVINTVRYIDLIKQVYKNIGSFPVIASKFDVGGEFYDQFCTNGNLIRQITDKPFTVKLKDLNEQLKEVCADYQINKNSVYVGQFEDFYPNYEAGVFLEHPDKDFIEKDNDSTLIKNFTYEYKDFENDRDEDNTLDAIHTNSEWYVPAENSLNKKEVKLPFFRDAYLFESIRRRATIKETTSESTDDKIGILDIVQLAPNSRGEINQVLSYDAVENVSIKILANKNINWLLLGFKVGDSVILTGSITTTRTVLEITASILTLSHTVGTLSETRRLILNYPLTDVQYVNRTNQGLIFTDNLLNPDNFSNLRYSIKRNLKHWYSLFATWGKFIPLKSFENKYFKSNGECITQFTGESNPIIENANIDFAEFESQKIINQNELETTVVASISSIRTLLTKLQTVNPDGSIGGFVRVQKETGEIVKGYISRLDYNWRYNELKLAIEEKNESDILLVTYDGTKLTINGTPYEILIRYNIFNEKIQFFDENNINLCNRTIYSNVNYNGVVYNSVDELTIAIGS